MMSSCCFCSVVCSWAAESLWTQKFSKPGSISNKETKWASLFSWKGRAVRVAVTCLVWTALRRSALFSAAPDAPWPPSSVGICPPETHNCNGNGKPRYVLVSSWRALPVAGASACLCASDPAGLPAPSCSGRSTGVPGPESTAVLWLGRSQWQTIKLSPRSPSAFASCDLSDASVQLFVARPRDCASSSLCPSQTPPGSLSLRFVFLQGYVQPLKQNSRVRAGIIAAGCPNAPSPDLLRPAR